MTNNREDGAIVRQPITKILHPVWHTLLWLMVFFLAVAECAAQGGNDVSIEQIRAAWQKRTESIKSFRCECQVEQLLVKGSRNEIVSRSPRASKEDVPNEDVTLRQTFMFCLSGKKMACSEQGEQWDDVLNQRKTIAFKEAFNTIEGRQLVEGATLPMGEIVNGGEPNDMLTNYTTVDAIWLWFSPIPLLQLQGYSPEKMAISQTHAFRDGIDCIELSTPSRGTSSWRAVICVDPSRNYVPVQFIRQHDGVARFELLIEYVSDEETGWRVSAWRNKWFHQTGDLDRSTSCKVTRCPVNQPIDDNAFTFEFPSGAHVAEKDGNTVKYFVAGANGERRYIAEREYGGLPPKQLHRSGMSLFRVVSIGIAVAGILAALTILKWRRQKEVVR